MPRYGSDRRTFNDGAEGSRARLSQSSRKRRGPSPLPFFPFVCLRATNQIDPTKPFETRIFARSSTAFEGSSQRFAADSGSRTKMSCWVICLCPLLGIPRSTRATDPRLHHPRPQPAAAAEAVAVQGRAVRAASPCRADGVQRASAAFLARLGTRLGRPLAAAVPVPVDEAEAALEPYLRACRPKRRLLLQLRRRRRDQRTVVADIRYSKPASRRIPSLLPRQPQPYDREHRAPAAQAVL